MPRFHRLKFHMKFSPFHRLKVHMKLSLVLVLGFTFSCSALECVFSVRNHTDQVPCGSQQFCRIAAVIDRLGQRFQDKSCSPSFLCNPMQGVRSYNLGYDSESLSYVCCNTDRCNAKDQPYPHTTPNGLQCYSCQHANSTICNHKVACVGAQDRCIGGTEPKGRMSYGCISRNMCDLGPVDDPSQTTGPESGPTCCKSSFCNSAEGLPESGSMNSASSVILSVFSSVLIPLTASII